MKGIESRRRLAVLVALTVALSGLALIGSCRSVVPNRNPIGERFPSVVGRTLTEEEVRLPEALAGEPCVLLVGYLQEAQFDADRWLYGLLQADLPVRILEVPTIPGLFPRLLADTIDSGMRSGIPSEDWASVITLYGDSASEVVQQTGDESGRNIRVLLIDSAGQIVWFHDRGFSAGKLIELEQLSRSGW